MNDRIASGVHMELIPVNLLTGFLGSGKSTLLTEILQNPDFCNTAVIVNEFGEIGLDGLLIQQTNEQIVEMTSGCLCCTIRGDIRQTLVDLYGKFVKCQIPKFDRVIVESTGLADPAPVVQTLMSDPLLRNRYMLGGVITTIDALHGSDTIERHKECEKQAAVADRLVITKSDLIDSDATKKTLSKLRSKLLSLNPTAIVLDRHQRDFEFKSLFDTSLYDPDTKSMNVRKWLNAEANIRVHNHSHGDASDHHGHHHHDITRHGSDIRSFTLTFDDPITIETLASSLEALFLTQGANILRVKGIANTVDRPDHPLVVHGVQHVFHDPVWLDDWPDESRQTQLVFITSGVTRESLELFFKSWISTSNGVWR